MIPGGNSSLSSLIVKFTTIARCNELIARACRRGGLNAFDVCSSWPVGRISICERAITSERRTFTKACRLATVHGVRRVWIRRGITYFRIKNNTLYRHLLGFTSLYTQLRFIPSVRSHPALLPLSLASGKGGLA